MITILIKQGRVDLVFGTNDYRVINFDLLEANLCPVCSGAVQRGREPGTHPERTTGGPYCPICQINWEETSSMEGLLKLTSPSSKFWDVTANLILLEWTGVQADSDMEAIDLCSETDILSGICLDRVFWTAEPAEEGGDDELDLFSVNDELPPPG